MAIKKIFNKKNFYITLISFALCFMFFTVMENIALFSESIYTINNNHHNLSLEFPLSLQVVEASTTNHEDNAEDVLMVSAFGLPRRRVSVTSLDEMKVIPSGMTVGVRIEFDGILVLGTGQVTDSDGQIHRPSDGILKPSDILLTANGEKLENKNTLINIINQNPEKIQFTLKRDGNIIEETVVPIRISEDNTSKLGLWVRDSTQGIGTITYINPETQKFGALGHGVIDADTKSLLPIGSGTIMQTSIKNVREGQRGVPGELVGDIQRENVIGEIKFNNEYGLYGILEDFSTCTSKEPIRIGPQNSVREGPAIIRANIDGTTVKEYDIFIESVNKILKNDLRGMVVRITDPELLARTGGIVQGMSGSPIIQNGKLVGAITHVFVQDAARGYGIFIENMIKQERLF